MAGPERQRPCLPVTGDRAVDDPGIDTAQLVVSQTKLFHDARPELLHDDVVLSDQFFDRLDGGCLLKIQMDRLLAAAQPGLRAGHRCPLDHGRPVDHQVVFVFAADLQDLRAEIRQRHCGVRSGKKCAEIQYFISAKCTHLTSILSHYPILYRCKFFSSSPYTQTSVSLSRPPRAGRPSLHRSRSGPSYETAGKTWKYAAESPSRAIFL